MSIKPTDLFYVDRGGTLYQVSWARIRERELLGSDELLVQRGSFMYRVAIGDFWDGTKDLDEDDLFEVERGLGGITDQNDPGYIGRLYSTRVPITPFFAIDFISSAGAGGDVTVNLRLAADKYDGDDDSARVQRPDGTFLYLSDTPTTYTFVQDGVHRFAGAFTVFEFVDSDSEIDASLTPGSTWALLNENNTNFGYKLFQNIPLLSGIPTDLKLNSLNLTFNSTNPQTGLDFTTLDVSDVTDGTGAFTNCSLSNHDLSGWETGNLETMYTMFFRANLFEGNGLDSWDVGNVTNMKSAFNQCDRFNGNIRNWDVSNLRDAQGMLSRAKMFNQPLRDWDTPNLEIVDNMLSYTDIFNQELFPSLGKTKNITSILAYTQLFNQIIPWDVSEVEKFTGAFQNAVSFNQDLSAWDTSNAQDFRSTFSGATLFNSDLSLWNTENVTNMADMFSYTQNFNQDLGEWNVSNVTNMTRTFKQASVFYYDISGWCVEKIGSEPKDFATDSPLNTKADWKPQWGLCPSIREGRLYLTSGTLKVELKFIGNGGYVIDPLGARKEYQKNVTYNEDWTQAGTYEISMDTCTTLKFENSTDADFDFHPEFYTGELTSLSKMFRQCRLFNGDISNWKFKPGVSSLMEMFYNCQNFNGDLSNWDTSNFRTLRGTFGRCTKIGEMGIERWDTSSATDMQYCFEFNPAFNVDVSGWDVSKVTRAESMFKGCTNMNLNLSGMNWKVNEEFKSMFKDCKLFNSDISDWDTTSAKNMEDMFYGASAFNQDLTSWCCRTVKAGATQPGGPSGIQPPGFAKNAGFDGQFDLHPIWNPKYAETNGGDFVCPAQVTVDPVIQSSDGSSLTVDPAGQALKVSDGEVDPAAAVDSQVWEGKRQGSSDWEEINTGGGDSTAVPPQFAEGSVRLVQYFGSTKAYSNVLTVTADSGLPTFGAFRFTNPGSSSDQVRIAGNIGSAGQIIYQDGTATNIGPGSFTELFDDEGVYSITTTDLTALNFRASNFDIEIDERSDLSDLRDASSMFEETKSVNDLGWWDTSQVTNMHRMFFNCHAYRVSPMDNNNVSGCTDMSEMFSGCDQMRINCVNWDTGNVTNMAAMFLYAGINRDNLVPNSLDNFDVSNVTNAAAMLSLTKYQGNLNEWNTSKFDDVTAMFAGNKAYVGPLNKWDVENVTVEMEMMFYESVFNQDISTWCVTQFDSEPFKFARDSPLDSLYDYKPQWGTCPGAVKGNVTLTSGTLRIAGYCTGSSFITGPNGFSEAISGTFSVSATDTGVYSLPMGEITKLNFKDSDGVFTFESGFETGNVENFSDLFHNCRQFNDAEVSNFDVSNVSNLKYAFRNALAFNQDLSSWDTGDCTSLMGTFWNTTDFNYDSILNWDVSDVENLSGAFLNCNSFNADISGWQVGSCTNFGEMFHRAYNFKQNLNTWDTSSAETFYMMFEDAIAFNSPLANWDTSLVSNMNNMFYRANAYNKDISNWCVPLVGSKPPGFDNSSGFQNLKDKQPQWGTCPVQVVQELRIKEKACDCIGPIDQPDSLLEEITLVISQVGITDPNGPSSYQWFKYTNGNDPSTMQPVIGQTGPQYLVQTDDGGNTFVLVQYITPSGHSQPTELTSNGIVVESTLPVDPSKCIGLILEDSNTLNIYIYMTQAGQMIFDTNTMSPKVTLASGWNNITRQSWDPGLYLIESEYCTAINFDNSSATFKLDERSYMDSITTASEMFYRCSRFNQDLSWWDTSNVTDMYRMFSMASRMSGSISGWNTSNVTNMNAMFGQTADGRVTSASKYVYWNPDVSSFDTSNCRDMSFMFYNSDYEGSLAHFDTSKVTRMEFMFNDCPFNSPIGNWNVSNVINMNSMFQGNSSFMVNTFSQDLTNWCVTKVQTVTASGHPQGKEPYQFASSAPYNNQRYLHPKWGTCPAQIVSNPVIY